MDQDASAWLREPIIVLPVALGLVFFLSLPIFAFGAQGAPAFYGAFFAAVTGLGGVVVGALYNARLVRRRDDRLERLNVLAAARVARYEFRTIQHRLKPLLEEFNKVGCQAIPENSDETPDDVDISPALLLQCMTGFGSKFLTPETDKHILELCKQSEAIADPLLDFLKCRVDLIDSEAMLQQELSKTEPGKRTIDYHTWYLFTAEATFMSYSVDDLVPALSQFIDEHAGDYA